jgi:hypothetical protein
MTSTSSLIAGAGSTASSLIKTDAKGRMHRTREQREHILDEYERSGLSGAKFAALCGVKYQTFAAWFARRKAQRNEQLRPKAARQVQWFEVQPTATCAPGLLLQLPGGVRAQLTSPEHIALAAALVRALEKPC